MAVDTRLRKMSPDPIMRTEPASGDPTLPPIGSAPGDTPSPKGRETLNWLGRITLPRDPVVPSELLRLEVKVVVGTDSKELDGGIKKSCEKDGAEKMLELEGIESTLSAAGASEGCVGETKSSEKDEVAGIKETVGTSLEELEREALETFASIASNVWHPTMEESCPPCGHDVLEEKAGMIMHNPSMRLFIKVNPFIR